MKEIEFISAVNFDVEKNLNKIKQNSDKTDEPVILMTEKLGIKLTTICETPHTKLEKMCIDFD